MKRRNAEIGKMRRPIKRNKITEGIYGSTVLYLKFFLVWMLVILADFILEFRFEFLWPFYLLLRSVYDSFKYQGLAFSIFFVCIALTSDMLCFFFIPVHWLFFAASTYVWVQYVWHTDKGICAPTIILWVLFVYLEAAVRLRDVKHMPGHLDLCRPFAAHCIGYPVVTLGFGFKSYVGYRMRQRRQRDVAKENEFYMQLIQQALPAEATATPQSSKEIVSAGGGGKEVEGVKKDNGNVATEIVSSGGNATVPAPAQKSQQSSHNGHRQSNEKNGHIPNGTIANGNAHQNSNSSNNSKSHHRKSMEKSKAAEKTDKTDKDRDSQQHKEKEKEKNNEEETHTKETTNNKKHTHSNGAAIGAGAEEAPENDVATSQSAAQPATPQSQPTAQQRSSQSNRRSKKEQQELNRDREANEYLQRLETDAKRLRTELQNSRQSEQELRLQVATLTTSEKVSKGELSSMQREMEDMQQRLQSAHSCRSQDKQTIAQLERRLTEERRQRGNFESQLAQERKSRKQEEQRAAQAAAQQQAQALSARAECTDTCKSRRRELEAEASEARAQQRWADERCAALQAENASLAEQLRETEVLMSALGAMQEKMTHLENSLSAENRIKLDLFSALGEAKRQLEIRESCTRAQEREIDELKSKIAQVLAVMPNDTFTTTGAAPTSASNLSNHHTQTSRVRLAVSNGGGILSEQLHMQNNLQQQQQQMGAMQGGMPAPGSTLDPNATAYTPKNPPAGMVAEA